VFFPGFKRVCEQGYPRFLKIFPKGDEAGSWHYADDLFAILFE